MTTLSHWFSLFVLEQPRLLVLAALLLAAAWIDSYAWRIPNVLTFGGSAAALFLSVLEPVAPGQALLLAFGGLALGLLVEWWVCLVSSHSSRLPSPPASRPDQNSLVLFISPS